MDSTIRRMTFDNGSNNSADFKQPNNRSYDANFKKFFQRKEVLAGILVNTVKELQNLPVDIIAERIRSSKVNPINAELLSNEDVDEKQKILYDIVVTVEISQNTEKEVHLIFDLEMQRQFKMQYPLMNRAIYYVSRLIAKQNIEHAHYENLAPVQSVWICVYDIPENMQNRHLHFEYSTYDEYGLPEFDTIFPGQDLTRIDFILLSENYDWDTNDDNVIKFLQSIFHNNMNDGNFNQYVAINSEISEEVLAMTSEREQYEAEMEAGRASSMAKGLAEGRAEGRAEGLAEGEKNAINRAATNMIKTNSNKETIVQTLMSLFSLSYNEAEKYFSDAIKN